MTSPPIVRELVDRFERDRDSYTSTTYNETNTRIDFIDRIFEEGLGWDVRNLSGASRAYKDVIHGDSIKVSGVQKAPDYCFRVGGTRKFFLEAKKPSVEIKDDPDAAFQLRRYAWSAKLPLSILTNFREFAVYDCRIRPKPTDKASVARVMFHSYDEYPDCWDEIDRIFSKKAVFAGSFDKYAESTKDKKGTSEVDDEFLNEIEGWRDSLARNIALRNPSITTPELNYAVQRTIDRIIFLRMCEDRGIEKYGQLKGLLENKDVYRKLFEIFRAADEKYNSGIFHFQREKDREESPDDLTPKLDIDDDVLASVIRGLYYPESPYEFSVLSATILGSVYEQFLGKVIRLTEGHHAKVEEKPEVKKAGGVYYTPEYIVDLIVSCTVGKLTKGKSPKQIEKLHVLDPACGSGSFLLGAYSFLLDYHLDWYVRNKPEKHPRCVYQAKNDEWRLTTSEKKRILLNNIYGVDIDPQAVEVTKLNLLLKVLEDESQDTLERQQRLWRERALPDLANNIKCGNSIVGLDYFYGKLYTDEDESRRINPFDWRKGFPMIMESGGFDAVIGNPPYVDSEWMTTHLKETRDYSATRYHAASGNWDLFCVFVEKAINLCRTNGFVSMIVPNKIGSAGYASGIRDVLAVHNHLLSIRDYSRVPVFPVAVYPIVFFAQKTTARKSPSISYQRMIVSEEGVITPMMEEKLDYSGHFLKPIEPWPIFSDAGAYDLVNRLAEEYPPLSSVADVWGAATVTEAYEIAPLITEGNPDRVGLRVVNSGTVDRYYTQWGHKKLKYLGKSFVYPVISAGKAKELPQKRKQQAETPKIIVASMTRRLECALDLDGSFLAGKSTSIVFPKEMDLRYLGALMNSKLIGYWFLSKFAGNALSGFALRVGPPQLRLIPVCKVDLKESSGRRQYERLIDIVGKVLDLRAHLAVARTPDDRTRIQRQIEDFDDQIDEVVYDLYHVSTEEQKAVEKSMAKV